MIRMKWTGLVGATALAIALGLAGAGCATAETGDTGGAGGGGTSPPEAACRDYATATCSKLGTCAPFFLELLYGDAATCTGRSTLECLAALKDPGVTATASDISACTSAYVPLSCDDAFGGSPLAACKAATRGKGSDGVACATSQECQSGACSSNDADGCGVCTPVGSAGDSCDPTNDHCESGLYCASATSVCEPANGAKGAMCDGSAQCKSSLYCLNGVCSAPLAEGASCDPAGDGCDFLHGLECNSSSSVCTPYKLAGPGEACGFDAVSNDLIFCTAGNCITDMNGAGLCAKPIADGAACTLDPKQTDPCFTPARCQNSVCTVALPTCK